MTSNFELFVYIAFGISWGLIFILFLLCSYLLMQIKKLNTNSYDDTKEEKEDSVLEDDGSTQEPQVWSLSNPTYSDPRVERRQDVLNPSLPRFENDEHKHDEQRSEFYREIQNRKLQMVKQLETNHSKLPPRQDFSNRYNDDNPGKGLRKYQTPPPQRNDFQNQPSYDDNQFRGQNQRYNYDDSVPRSQRSGQSFLYK